MNACVRDKVDGHKRQCCTVRWILAGPTNDVNVAPHPIHRR
jgi:hypothetical protein